MILVIDAETSGLLRDDLPAESPEQPHLVQIGAHLFDPTYEPLCILETLIRPNGWSIEPEAYAVHGIDEARCSRFGIDVRVALAALQQMSVRARVIVAHHMNFDRKIIAAQLARIGSDGSWWQRQSAKFRCTMEMSVEHCRIPGEFGLKYPSLAEAYRHFHPGLEYVPTHRVGDDIRACAAIYRKLQEITA